MIDLSHPIHPDFIPKLRSRKTKTCMFIGIEDETEHFSPLTIKIKGWIELPEQDNEVLYGSSLNPPVAEEIITSVKLIFGEGITTHELTSEPREELSEILSNPIRENKKDHPPDKRIYLPDERNHYLNHTKTAEQENEINNILPSSVVIMEIFSELARQCYRLFHGINYNETEIVTDEEKIENTKDDTGNNEDETRPSEYITKDDQIIPHCVCNTQYLYHIKDSRYLDEMRKFNNTPEDKFIMRIILLKSETGKLKQTLTTTKQSSTNSKQLVEVIISPVVINRDRMYIIVYPVREIRLII